MGNFGLIDLHTPLEAYKKYSLRDNSEMILVFSDEFNTPGRTFYPGDDPYWEAVDLHYWVGSSDPCFFSLLNYLRQQTTWSGTTQKPLRQKMAH